MREAVGTLRLMTGFNWHATLRMPGSEPSFSLARQGFPLRGHTHKARVLLFPPLYTSHRLMLQEYSASVPNMDMGCTCEPSSGLHRALSNKECARGARICLVHKASTKGTHLWPWQGLFDQSGIAFSVFTMDSHLSEVASSQLFFSLPGALSKHSSPAA